MLFMVIERFKNASAVGERFKREGRMLLENVTYRESWVEPSGARCFQLMEAPDAQSLEPWMSRWRDLVEFEIIPVRTSEEFWSKLGGEGEP